MNHRPHGRGGVRLLGTAALAALVFSLGSLAALAQPAGFAGRPAGLVSPAPAPEPSPVELVARSAWGGKVNAVFVDPGAPDIAYVGAGRRLVVLNVADPANVIELGSIDLGTAVMDLKVRAGYAYVATFFHPNNFCVVDVSDPAAPELIWHHESVSGYFTEVDLYGDFAYVRVGTSMPDLHVFDVSNPENPLPRGGVISGAHPCGVTIVGNLMYAVVYEAGPNIVELHVYDLSGDPLNPVLRGTVQLESPFWFHPVGITVEGNWAYVTSRDPALGIVDVSNPEAPVVVYSDEGIGSRVRVADGYLYAPDGTNGLRVFDVTDPNSPTLIATLDTRGSCINTVEVIGTTVYAMDTGEGVVILDVSDPSAPGRLGGWYCPAYLRKLAKVGDLLYATDRVNGINILDVSDPNDVALVGMYQTDAYLHRGNWGIAVRDSLAYLAAGYNGLDVVDVTDPANPVRVGGFPFNPGIYAQALELDGDIAHVGTAMSGGGGWLVNFDISDLQNIVDVGSLNLGYCPLMIATASSAVSHIAAGSPGGQSGYQYAVDVSAPEDPFLVWSSGLGTPRDVCLDGSLLYVANGDSDFDIAGLYTYDVSDPINPPVELGCFAARFTEALALQDGLAYLLATRNSTGWPGLLVLDVSDPQNPGPMVAHLPMLGFKHALLVDEGYAYMTGGAPGDMPDVGLLIVEIVQGR